jgi:hypothetical protein
MADLSASAAGSVFGGPPINPSEQATAGAFGVLQWQMNRGFDAAADELLALYVFADKQNWVAWTPEGFYVELETARAVSIADLKAARSGTCRSSPDRRRPPVPGCMC